MKSGAPSRWASGENGRSRFIHDRSSFPSSPSSGMKLLARLVALLIVGGSSLLHADSSTEVREGAWTVAQAIVDKMTEADLHDCPGLTVWRREFMEAGKTPLALDAD